MRTIRSNLLLLVAALAVSCATPSAPEDFLVVDGSRKEVKAIAPDDSLFWVREFKDRNQGEFEFWRETLENEFVENRGYTLLDRRDVRWGEDPGVEFLFEVTAKGRARRYLVTMAVRAGFFANRVQVAEFVADKERFDAHVAAVRAALGT